MIETSESQSLNHLANQSGRRGLFISLEGTEGVGKTTNLAFIRDWLCERELIPWVTREPGGTPLAEAIRELTKTPDYSGMPAASELLLMFAARADHLEREIKPRLADGQCVLTDRYIDASYAYQGGGRGLELDRLAWLEAWVVDEYRPDLTILLDAPTELGLERADARSARDRFEREAASFHQRVRQAYLDRAAAEPERFRLIDASRPLVEVQRSLRETLESYLANYLIDHERVDAT